MLRKMQDSRGVRRFRSLFLPAAQSCVFLFSDASGPLVFFFFTRAYSYHEPTFHEYTTSAARTC